MNAQLFIYTYIWSFRNFFIIYKYLNFIFLSVNDRSFYIIYIGNQWMYLTSDHLGQRLSYLYTHARSNFLANVPTQEINSTIPWVDLLTVEKPLSHPMTTLLLCDEFLVFVVLPCNFLYCLVTFIYIYIVSDDLVFYQRLVLLKIR